MRRSDLFLPASREVRGEGTDVTKLLRRAGLIREFGSGLWGFTPAGERVRRKVEDRIRTGMDDVGAQEVRLPGLQYRERWADSGRWGSFEGKMLTLQNRDGQDMCLAPSHEEGMVHLFDGVVRSYDDLPLVVYQVASKFRDDHARNGLVRCKEFTMKDAYSFHVDEASLAATYDAMRAAYEAIFADLGFEFAVVEAEAEVMGGSASEEFVAPVADGSDRLVHCTADGCRFGVTVERSSTSPRSRAREDTDEHPDFADHHAGDDCPDCGGELAESDGIELGHVFQLGTRYSEPMDLAVHDAEGREREVLMGSYGIGVERAVQALLQQTTDDHGTDSCRWPVTDCGCVAPYRAGVVPVGEGEAVQAAAEDVHDSIGAGDCLLFDDDTQSVGERFAEADLLGLPATVVVGNTYRETGLVDVEDADGHTEQVDPETVPAVVERYAAGDATGR
jgi:prolyl-tRNA synthetase